MHCPKTDPLPAEGSASFRKKMSLRPSPVLRTPLRPSAAEALVGAPTAVWKFVIHQNGAVGTERSVESGAKVHFNA